MIIDPENERHRIASEGMIFSQLPDDSYRTTEVWLGKEAVFEDFYAEIPEDTPMPEPPEPEPYEPSYNETETN